MDLRSERAVALLSEFLDSEDVWIPDPPGPSRRPGENADTDEDTPFKRVKRHKHAEHFAHGESNQSSALDLLSRFADHCILSTASGTSELYTYLRSPFEDLAMWDRTVQVSVKLEVEEAYPGGFTHLV